MKKKGNEKLTKEEIINDLMDYCNQKGKFEYLEDYYGMSGSSIPQTFFESYFDKLSENKKLETAEIIISAYFSEIIELLNIVNEIGFLVGILCSNKYSFYIRGLGDKVENYYVENINIDKMIEIEGEIWNKEFKEYWEEWKIFYHIYRLLVYTKSEKSEEILRKFKRKSNSKDLIEMLKNSKKY